MKIGDERRMILSNRQTGKRALLTVRAKGTKHSCWGLFYFQNLRREKIPGDYQLKEDVLHNHSPLEFHSYSGKVKRSAETHLHGVPKPTGFCFCILLSGINIEQVGASDVQ